MYLAVALFFITNLFSLYRLSRCHTLLCQPSLSGVDSVGDQTDRIDWWPKQLGGKTSYALSWGITLLIGLTAHHLDLFRMRERRRGKGESGGDELDWERKSRSLLENENKRGARGLKG